MEKFKREMGSITVVVFATVTFILIILSTIYVTVSQKRKSQAIEIQDLKEIYDMDMSDIAEEIASTEEITITQANQDLVRTSFRTYSNRFVYTKICNSRWTTKESNSSRK